MYTSIVENISIYLKTVGELLKSELRADGHFATGQTEKSIRVEEGVGYIALKSNGAPKYLTEGSKPVRNGSGGVLYKAILEWVKSKGVTPPAMTDKTFAYLIYRKRVRDGYLVPNKFNGGDTVKRAIDLQKITKDIEIIVSKNIVETIETSIKL